MAEPKKTSGVPKMLGEKKRMTDANLLLVITIAVFVGMYLFAMLVFGEGYLRFQTFLDLLETNACLIIVSCGMSIVMIAGGIDISVGGVVMLVAMCCAVNLEHNGGNIMTSMLIALGIGLAFGLIQGYLVAYLDIQPFIVTLAGMFFAKGMTTIVYGEPFNVKQEAFKNFARTSIEIPGMGYIAKSGKYMPAEVEIGVIVAIVIVILLFCILRWTKTGRNLYAVGGNSQSALMLGINVKRTKFLSHLICGLLAGIGGYIYFMHNCACSTTNPSGMEMNAIASSIIGGTMLTGGVGNLIGTFFGVLSLTTIQSIVASAGLEDACWIGITVAAMLCIFLIVQSLVIGRKKKA
ncbi:MAG: sugar ABC transporter permease YjfF [Lachnospiraceae bacterium]|nr:sugar ABC transporter permease YjfF [Lachnospiraceae bacterium]